MSIAGLAQEGIIQCGKFLPIYTMPDTHTDCLCLTFSSVPAGFVLVKKSPPLLQPTGPSYSLTSLNRTAPMPVAVVWSTTALPPTALEPSVAELLGHFMCVS